MKATWIKWKNILDPWTSKTNTVQLTIPPKTICRFNAIPIKIPVAFFIELDLETKFVWKQERSQITKTILKRKNRAGCIILPDFTLYFKAIVINTVRYWHEHGCIEAVLEKLDSCLWQNESRTLSNTIQKSKFLTY